MQDMPFASAAIEDPSAANETPAHRAKHICVEVLLRAWATAKRSEPITHRAVQAVLERVRSGFQGTNSPKHAVQHAHESDPAPESFAAHEALKSHNAVWRCVEEHPGAHRVPGMKPRGFRLNAKDLMPTRTARAEHSALYESMRDAAKTV